jgi:hypothetical protein
MSDADRVCRRRFLGTSLAAVGATGAVAAAAGATGAQGAENDTTAADTPSQAGATDAPYGMIGKVKISRLLLGGNLVGGFMHARDLKYVGQLFRAYVTEEKILETMKLAEEHGINTVLETGAGFVQQYNKEYGGKMQIIPSIHPDVGLPEQKLKDEIKRTVDAGAAAMYVWGVAGDRLVQLGEIDLLARAVELAKDSGVPIGVGSHSLQVPIACEKHDIPCDFYVKTLHADDYPSATAKELRKEYIWLDRGEGWYDNMWCIDPEETIEFMRTVTKPWIAFKVLAAGAIHPRQGFAHAFQSGADFIGVGMFDFQIEEDAELVRRLVAREKDRPRPWCA